MYDIAITLYLCGVMTQVWTIVELTAMVLFPIFFHENRIARRGVISRKGSHVVPYLHTYTTTHIE